MAVIFRAKEINKLKKFAGCSGNFEAHFVEIEMDSRGEYKCMDGILVCIKIWFLGNR